MTFTTENSTSTFFMIRKIYPQNPNQREIENVVKILLSGGVVIYPTDTMYGIGCDIFSNKAVDKLARIKGVKLEEANFSIICQDLSQLSHFSKPLDNAIFKLMKRSLPGPYTFIINANNQVPKIFTSKKRTIGIRVPANNVVLEIVKLLGNPLLTTSIEENEDEPEFNTDPELIYEKYSKSVDLLIDGGMGTWGYSTVIDCTGELPVLVRQGLGEIDF